MLLGWRGGLRQGRGLCRRMEQQRSNSQRQRRQKKAGSEAEGKEEMQMDQSTRQTGPTVGQQNSRVVQEHPSISIDMVGSRAELRARRLRLLYRT